MRKQIAITVIALFLGFSAYAQAGITSPVHGFGSAVKSFGQEIVTTEEETIAAPVNTVAPVISGTQRKGQTLTTTNGTWDNAPDSYTYQWKRAGASIGGATASTYVLTIADAGKAITCEVTATNAGGSTAQGSNTLTMSAFVDFVLASAVADLDATLSSSYGGSGQTLTNGVTAPADGSAQTAYDAWLGIDNTSSASDPAFTGSAGSAAAYFALDGGDYFTFKSVVDPLTLYNMHRKTGGTNKWWVAMAYQTGDDTGVALWGRGYTGGTYGVYLWRAASNTSIYHDYGATTELQNGGLNQAASTNYILIVSVDMEATSNNVKFWLNTTTAATFSKTWSSDNNNPTRNFHIGATVNSGGTVSSPMASGGRIYGFYVGNELLDDAKAADIFALIEARHERDYTP